MWTFILWLILLVVCWPLALLALVLYPIVWLLLLPFRLISPCNPAAAGPRFARPHTRTVTR
jgi:hypothetical protein